MIITIDTETQGLNAQNFIMGCIVDENENAQHFDNRQEMIRAIDEHLEKAKKYNKKLMIYAHNMQYDYHVLYWDKIPKNHHQYCNSPFLVDVHDGDEKQKYGMFISTTNFFKGRLEELGEILEMPKGKTPEWLKQDKYNPDFTELAIAHQYMENDAKICLKLLKELKKTLKEHKINPRWLITSGQIGISLLMKAMDNAPNSDAFIYGLALRKLHKTRFEEEIQESVRGGRIEAFCTGQEKTATALDVNSQYPAILATMRMPDLSTQTRHRWPLRTWRQKDLLEKLGVSKCSVLITEPAKYGILQMRLNRKENHTPNTKGQVLIGTWTHLELQEAIKRGWKILDIEWSHTWEETENPFRETIERIYEMKKNPKNAMEKQFAKMILNYSVGKFAQKTIKYDYAWAPIEKHHSMIKKGWDAIEEEGNQRLYQREIERHMPRHYAPFINALVTAQARMQILSIMEIIPPEDLYYVDTDCVIFNDSIFSSDYMLKYFNIGKELGQLKIANQHEPFYAYGKKTYRIGKDIKASGAGKTWTTMEDFQKGTITYKRMQTKGNTQDKTQYGTFKTHQTNLNETTHKEQEDHKKYAEEKLLIDHQSQETRLYESQETLKYLG